MSPNITVVGKDIYVDIFDLDKNKWQYASDCIDKATNYEFRNYFLDIGGHNDGSFSYNQALGNNKFRRNTTV